LDLGKEKMWVGKEKGEEGKEKGKGKEQATEKVRLMVRG